MNDIKTATATLDSEGRAAEPPAITAVEQAEARQLGLEHVPVDKDSGLEGARRDALLAKLDTWQKLPRQDREDVCALLVRQHNVLLQEALAVRSSRGNAAARRANAKVAAMGAALSVLGDGL